MGNTIDFNGKTLNFEGDKDAFVGARKVLVTGARRATPYGMALAEMVGRTCAELGLLVMNGAGIGCESAALRAAQGAGGDTIVVSACGIDQTPYPKASTDVYEGATLVVTQEPDGMPPRPYNFVKRNALEAEMCDLAIVCECGMSSGIMSLARQCKQVLAFPGSVFSAVSQGTNELIARGDAEMVTGELHLLALLRDRFGVLVEYPLPDREPHTGILASLVASPTMAGELAKAHDMDIVDMLRALSSLEREGKVVRLPDGKWSPNERVLV